ncbi:MAG TPA: glycosyltransferase family 2 protein [Candidatus Saccharimonadales bacterium]|nr:glycosyltransferase family 2 protein [Candidatus Saccharimonadales bacterium]
MSPQNRKLVSVIIPCYNEAGSIKKVVRDFHKSELTNAAFDFDIIVIDNASTDGTADKARETDARVISEPKKGKGRAIRAGFNNIHPRASYVVMIDGDDTYRPEEVLRLLEPLHHGFCDAVVGSRLSGKIHNNSMTFLNRFGNWTFTHMVRYFYSGANVTDVLSGYFAWKRKTIDELVPHLKAPHFAIEMEMITKMAKMGYEVYSVPITYNQRLGEANLRPFGDGFPILIMFLKNLHWKHRVNTEDGLVEEEV